MKTKCKTPVCDFLKYIFKSPSINTQIAKENILKGLQPIINLKYASYWTYNRLFSTLHLGATTTDPQNIGNPIIDLDTPAGDVFHSGRGYIQRDDVSIDPRYRDKNLLKLYNLKSMVVIRVDSFEDEGKLPIGCVCLYPETLLSEEQLLELKECIDLSYLVIKQGISFLKLNVASAINKALLGYDDKNSYLFSVIRGILAYFPIECISIFLYDDINDRFYLGNSSHSFIGQKKSDIFYDIKQPFFHDLKKGESKLFAKTEAKEYFDSLTFKEDVKKGYSSCILVPIVNLYENRKTMGFVRYVNERNRIKNDFFDYFSNEDLNLFKEFSEVISNGLRFFEKEDVQKEIFSKISHEMHVPLEGIQAKAERLLYPEYFNDNDMNKKKHIEDIFHLSKLSIALFSQFSSLKESKVELEIDENIKLYSDIIINCIKSLNPYLQELGIPSYNRTKDKQTIYYHEADIKIVPQMNLDQNKIMQVFFNVLSNAIKYHKRDEKDSFEVEIRSQVLDNYLYVLISDNGIGVDQEEANTIFEKYKRGKKAYRYHVYGTGLGLHLAKLYMRLHKGDIVLLSREEYSKYGISERFSTTFLLKFPKELYSRRIN